MKKQVFLMDPISEDIAEIQISALRNHLGWLRKMSSEQHYSGIAESCIGGMIISSQNALVALEKEYGNIK